MKNRRKMFFRAYIFWSAVMALLSFIGWARPVIDLRSESTRVAELEVALGNAKSAWRGQAQLEALRSLRSKMFWEHLTPESRAVHTYTKVLELDTSDRDLTKIIAYKVSGLPRNTAEEYVKHWPLGVNIMAVLTFGSLMGMLRLMIDTLDRSR